MQNEGSAKPATKRGLIRNVIVILIGIVAIGFGIFKSLHIGTNPNIIVASGSLEADETIIAPKVAGRLAKLNVDEGSDVKKGQLLATLDDTELRTQLGQAEAAEAAAQAKLDEAVKGNRPEQIQQARAQLDAAQQTYGGAQRNLVTASRNFRTVTDLRTTLDAAEAKAVASQAAYSQAVQALKLMKAGTRPQQVDQARAALAQAKVALDQAQLQFARADTLAKQGALAQQQADDARAARDAAQRAVEQAQSHLNDLAAGARPEEISGAQQAVLMAKANLDGSKTALADAQRAFQDRLAAQSQYDSATSGAQVARAQVQAAQSQYSLMLAGSRLEDIQTAKATVAQTKKAVEYAQQLVADTRLYAPGDGVIKTKSALPGETLSPGTPVVTLADLDHVWIRVYVPEDQYGKLALQQPVDVTVDSFPNEIFKGKILSIASGAEFTPKNAQTPEERVKLVFAVKIAVENPNRKLKPGMPGDATIHVD